MRRASMISRRPCQRACARSRYAGARQRDGLVVLAAARAIFTRLYAAIAAISSAFRLVFLTFSIIFSLA